MKTILWHHETEIIKVLENIIGVFENDQYMGIATSYCPICSLLNSNKGQL